MSNLRIYEKVRVCPDNAKKPIMGGKLKGKSDINPMFRIKTLTEMFGPCGIGWKPCDEHYWTTPGANGEVIAWCSLNLVYREDPKGPWSDPVPGIGGSMLVELQKGNLTSNDEAFKMAHTDAISVACKQLGVAADVYWEQDRTKYDKAPDEPPAPPAPPQPAPAVMCERCGKPITAMKHCGKVYSIEEIAANSKATYGSQICWACMKTANEQRNGAAQSGAGEAG